jgi:hypothetical protein
MRALFRRNLFEVDDLDLCADVRVETKVRGVAVEVVDKVGQRGVVWRVERVAGGKLRCQAGQLVRAYRKSEKQVSCFELTSSAFS